MLIWRIGRDPRRWGNARYYRVLGSYQPDQTILELSTAGLIPQETMEQLHAIFGDDFYSLDELETKIVVSAAVEGWINHERACELTEKHTREVTLILPRLVNKNFLVAAGENKHKYYTLPGVNNIPTPDNVFAASALPKKVVPAVDLDITHREQDITHSDDNITHNTNNITHKSSNITHNEDIKPRDQHGRLLSELLSKPIIDDLNLLQQDFYEELNSLASPVKAKSRTSKEQMREVIAKLCTGHFIEVAQLASLLNRTSQSIRQNYLKSMVEDNLLELAFPQSPRTPRQAYSTK